MGEVALHDREGLVEVGLDAQGELGDERLGLVERALEVAALLAQELDVLRQAGAFGLGQGVDRTDAVAAPFEALETIPQRRCLVVAPRPFEAADLERRRYLFEARRDLETALLETGDGHLSRSPPFAQLVDLAAQSHLFFGQTPGGRPVADAPFGLAGFVAEPRDERLDPGLQRRERGGDVGTGRRRPGDALEPGVELPQAGARAVGAALGAAPLIGRALLARAPFIELDARPREHPESVEMDGLGRGAHLFAFGHRLARGGHLAGELRGAFGERVELAVESLGLGRGGGERLGQTARALARGPMLGRDRRLAAPGLLAGRRGILERAWRRRRGRRRAPRRSPAPAPPPPSREPRSP